MSSATETGTTERAVQVSAKGLAYLKALAVGYESRRAEVVAENEKRAAARAAEGGCHPCGTEPLVVPPAMTEDEHLSRVVELGLELGLRAWMGVGPGSYVGHGLSGEALEQEGGFTNIPVGHRGPFGRVR